MTDDLDPGAAAACFRWACRLDVEAFKPGNVSLGSPGHGMTADQFVASGDAAAPALCRPGATLGARIDGATAASMAVAGCNTNLGIVLLCAPLVLACERLAAAAPRGVVAPTRAARLREALRQVLSSTTVDDAAGAFRAIALAHPGGLGRVERQDVHEAPTLDLRAAMALAADRDLIARQYVDAFALVFGRSWPAFQSVRRGAAAAQPGGQAADAATRPVTLRRAMQHAYLQLLVSEPDSHIVRKHGEAAAHSVMSEAAPLWDMLQCGKDEAAQHALRDWDHALKARGLNPGTSADLAVATAFVAAACDPVLAGAIAGAPPRADSL